MRRSMILPLSLALCLGLVSGCDVNSLLPSKGTSQTTACNTNEIFPFNNGAQAEFKLYLNGKESGSAAAVLENVGTTCKLKVLTRIGDQEKGMLQTYQWNDADLVVTEQNGSEPSRTYTALKLPLEVGSSWSAGTETVRVASIGELSTELGTLKKVVRIDHSSGGKIFTSLWYAEGYGIVQVEYEVDGGTDRVLMKIAKYTNSSACTLTAEDLFPINSTKQVELEMIEEGSKVGTVTASMKDIGTGKAELTISETGGTPFTETYERTTTELKCTEAGGVTQTWLRFPLKVGMDWTALMAPNEERTWVVASVGSLTTPVQTFSEVVRVVRMSQGTVEQSFWFAKGAGIVQLESRREKEKPMTLYRLTRYVP